MSLAIVGGTVVDLIFPGLARLPAWPRHGEFTPANLVLSPVAPIVTLGGNGANAAFVAARCGASVALHTRIGGDALGGLARRWLAEAGCRVHGVGGAPGTAVNVTAADSRHRRATFFYPGPPGAPMPALAAARRPPRHVLICGWPHPPLAALVKELRALRSRGAFTALDPGPILTRPWRLAALRPVLASLDLFIANEYELRKIAGAHHLDLALARIRRHFAGHVVVKRGAAGALWLPAHSDEARPVTGRRTRVMNTIGAGDSFNGSLLAALANGTAFFAALREAAAVAASVVGSPRGLLGVRPPTRAASAGAQRKSERSTQSAIAR